MAETKKHIGLCKNVYKILYIFIKSTKKQHVLLDFPWRMLKIYKVC